MDFKIFSQFPISGVGLTPGAISNVLHILPVTQGMKIYCLGVGISIDFKIFNNFSILGGGG